MDLIISSFRLADEVEQRTDVRKSGMEGFYSNLMTKNVAMGGDVDAHAVSVYTAGSARQSHLMDEAKSVSASVQQAKAKVDSRGGGCSSSGSSVGTAGTSDKSSTKHDQSVVRTDICDDGRILDLSRAKREGASDEQPRKAQRTSSNVDKETVVGTETVVGAETVGNIMKPTVMVDKTEVILSAKDRYLARKRALEGNNSV